jgi:tetratricopeptide (TPR) repeat protein
MVAAGKDAMSAVLIRFLEDELREGELMNMPTDVQDLMESLRQLGIDQGLVTRAEEILSAKAEDIGEWIELAVALRERGEFHAALETYDSAMRRFPDSHMLWGNRGFLLLYWERYDEALENFTEALRIKPDYTTALANMASTYECLHEFEKAAQIFQRVVELAPEHAIAWNSLGLCLSQLGDDERAKPCYAKSLAVRPDYKDPLFNLASLLCSQRKYAEALPYAQQLLALEPNDAEAVQLRDEILQEPVEPRGRRARDTYREKRIFRLARREGADPRMPPRPEDIELVSYTVRTPSNIAYDDPTSMPGNWDKPQVWEIVRRVLSDAGPPSPFDEPTIFISYRWESEEHSHWVARFANDLMSRGYGIVYDGDLRRLATPPSVPELVARIATCNYFMPILTEPYRRRVELASNDVAVKEDGWVFDEWQLALKLYVIERLKIVGVWRSGPVVPVPLTKDRVLDFRDSAAYLQLLEHCFPRPGQK